MYLPDIYHFHVLQKHQLWQPSILDWTLCTSLAAAQSPNYPEH